MACYLVDFYVLFFSVDVAVFGTSVETATQRSQLGTDGIELPTVFRECIDYLEERGQ